MVSETNTTWRWWYLSMRQIPPQIPLWRRDKSLSSRPAEGTSNRARGGCSPECGFLALNHQVWREGKSLKWRVCLYSRTGEKDLDFPYRHCLWIPLCFCCQWQRLALQRKRLDFLIDLTVGLTVLWNHRHCRSVSKSIFCKRCWSMESITGRSYGGEISTNDQ